MSEVLERADQVKDAGSAWTKVQGAAFKVSERGPKYGEVKCRALADHGECEGARSQNEGEDAEPC
jgi:hypothetical protein